MAAHQTSEETFFQFTKKNMWV